VCTRVLIYEYMYPFITGFIGVTQVDTVCANSGKTMTDANCKRSNLIYCNEAGHHTKLTRSHHINVLWQTDICDSSRVVVIGERLNVYQTMTGKGDGMMRPDTG